MSFHDPECTSPSSYDHINSEGLSFRSESAWFPQDLASAFSTSASSPVLLVKSDSIDLNGLGHLITLSSISAESDVWDILDC